ncbi:MAG: M14 family metallopeptidase, partial [Candidatus Aminicenantales bacterium]
MRVKLTVLVLALGLVLNTQATEVKSLSDVLKVGSGIQDTDRDGFAERSALCVVIPEHPSVYETAAAADLAARVNFECLAVDFGVVKTAQTFHQARPPLIPVYLASTPERASRWAGKQRIPLRDLRDEDGLVAVLSDSPGGGLLVAGGSGKALLQTARAFFLRWPYLWDVWGREEGATYFSVEKDLADFLSEEKISFSGIRIRSAAYRFPEISSPHETIKKLRFQPGEISTLEVLIEFDTSEAMQRAHRALQELLEDHRRGLRTSVLSYAGCARLALILREGTQERTLSLDRMGSLKRMLTPSYKTPFRPKITGKKFDLRDLYTLKGFYGDQDGDRIPDTLESLVILPQEGPFPGLSLLTSRLVLGTAGASFPIVALDEDIETLKPQKAPILVGKSNAFVRDLIKKGKFQPPFLQEGWGSVTVVPEAFNPSSAVVILGGEAQGLGQTLRFISTKFPYFEGYGPGHPSIRDVSDTLEEFFEGKHGSAEAWFFSRLKTYLDGIKDKAFTSFRIRLCVPEKREPFLKFIQNHLVKTLRAEKIEVQGFSLKEAKTIFEKTAEFRWEGREAIRVIQEHIRKLPPAGPSLWISVGVSESPETRMSIKKEIEALLAATTMRPFEVEVLSSYKQGFFWLTENVIPKLQGTNVHHIRILFRKEKDDFSVPKRFYADPYRWLQELYPVDEIVARKLKIPLERIVFEAETPSESIYEIQAYDAAGQRVFQDRFTPKTRERVYLSVLPEWGSVKTTTGWVRIYEGDRLTLDLPLESDLETFWKYYQQEVLPEVYAYVLKKTGEEPTFKKQPYFKKLQVELWLSEPDFRLGLDEEIISSLEALHDEIYFDTLDFLRGITEVELEEDETPEDTSRYSAPGNVLPVIHPSTEGQAGKVKITFEDWRGRSPEMTLEWEERGRKTRKKTFSYPKLKPKTLRFPSFIYNGPAERVETLVAEVETEKEKEYTTLIEIGEACRDLQAKGVIPPSFRMPNLHTLTLRLRHKDLKKEEILQVASPERPSSPPPLQSPEPVSVPTDTILSPRMCVDLAERLGRFPCLRTYPAGRSYEGRPIPVIEAFMPESPYVSVPRLITFKPTLFVTGRQHANEVSATNYILKFAELLASDPATRDYLKKLNIVLHPMENPDGAELAYRLQSITPFHSLHAGRYSSLGMDVGAQVGAKKPLLPEAKVRKTLDDRWLPDISLNLHGYPSHEWVQPFSGYVPYLFRDYWIPRGWFVYFRGVSLPVYARYRKAAEALRASIIQELTSDPEIATSNK